MAAQPRALRADARANHDRILEAAAAVFARPGADTSMRAIAAEAGVGVGTLYRRFPQREQLIEASYRSETIRLAESAAGLLSSRSPDRALREWMDLFADYLAAKEGMGDSLRAILTDEGDRMRTRYLLADAIAPLLEAGAASGVLRADVPAYDALLAIGGAITIAGGPDRKAVSGRLLDLVLDSLRA